MRKTDMTKNRRVKGKKSTIGNPQGTHVTVQGPDTYKSDLRGGALDEFVAPRVKKAKNIAKELGGRIKASGKRLQSNVNKIVNAPRKQKRSYTNNTYTEGE